MLALLGGGLLIVGLLFIVLGRFPAFGQLPGNIVIERENFTCFVPLGAMILVSLLLTLVLNVLVRFLNRGP